MENDAYLQSDSDSEFIDDQEVLKNVTTDNADALIRETMAGFILG